MGCQRAGRLTVTAIPEMLRSEERCRSDAELAFGAAALRNFQRAGKLLDFLDAFEAAGGFREKGDVGAGDALARIQVRVEGQIQDAALLHEDRIRLVQARRAELQAAEGGLAVLD